MTDERRHKLFGSTMSEWLSELPLDIDDIGIGLGRIVHAGRYGFEFSGAELIEFVRRGLYALVKTGAKPRHRGKPGQPERNIVLHYGNGTEEEIVEGVIADWVASGAGDPEWGDFWFELSGTVDED